MFITPSKLLFENGYSRIIIRKFSESILPYDVIWNKSKSDPLRLISLRSLLDKACESLFDQIEEFRNNPYFEKIIDFNTLSVDLKNYFNKKISGRPHELFEIMFFLKKFNEFAKQYHNIDFNTKKNLAIISSGFMQLYKQSIDNK